MLQPPLQFAACARPGAGHRRRLRRQLKPFRNCLCARPWTWAASDSMSSTPATISMPSAGTRRGRQTALASTTGSRRCKAPSDQDVMPSRLSCIEMKPGFLAILSATTPSTTVSKPSPQQQLPRPAASSRGLRRLRLHRAGGTGEALVHAGPQAHRSGGGTALLSWSGSMFRVLIPALVMREHQRQPAYQTNQRPWFQCANAGLRPFEQHSVGHLRIRLPRA